MAELPYDPSFVSDESWPRRIFFDDVTREVFVPDFLASAIDEADADMETTVEVAIQMVEADNRSIVIVNEGHYYLPLSFLEVNFKESVAAGIAKGLRCEIEKQFNLPPLRSH